MLGRGGKKPRKGGAGLTLGRVNQLIRERAAQRGAGAETTPDRPPDPFREWAERSLGLKR